MLQTKPTIETSSPTVIRSRVLVYLVVLGALCAGGVMNASAQSNLILYRQLAVELSEQALALQDDDVARQELARRAADLDPSLADPLVILSRLLQDEQQSQREREDLLRRALSSDFVRIERVEAVTALAELLVQQERFQEALSLLDAEHIINGAAPMERLIGFIDRADDSNPARTHDEDVSRLDRLYMTALLGGDAPWFAGRLLQRLRSQFPLDRELGAMDWRRSTHLSVGVLEWIDAMEQLTGGVSAEMYRELIQAGTPSVLIPMLQRRYRQAGGSDPLVAAVAMVHGSDDLPDGDALSADKMIWELFFQHLDPADLPNELDHAMDEMREQDRVVLTRDEDRDGFWEERYSFRQGSLSLWQHDENQ
ncbi:MAG TPA: hypothetical protein VJ932_08550, partial [Alkalispirochaeta sp.]|nr:hypothetical protein [Alkalispirochaeta sp.]